MNRKGPRVILIRYCFGSFVQGDPWHSHQVQKTFLCKIQRFVVGTRDEEKEECKKIVIPTFFYWWKTHDGKGYIIFHYDFVSVDGCCVDDVVSTFVSCSDYFCVHFQ